MKTIQVALGERSYPIYIGSGVLEKFGQLYGQHELGERAALITDKTVERLHGSRSLAQLKSIGVDAQLISVPPGESSKSLEWLDRLYTRLLWAGFDQDATVVALGGGVVGDLAGFLAATYRRGIRWVQVPTTLLAQVDAAVEGKTGINHRLGKNLIGAVHPPQFVLTDAQLLRTLPKREWYAGLAAIIQCGLIYDQRFLAQLETHWESFQGDLERVSMFIERSMEIRSEIVSADEREAGSLSLLNFGHTIGHALEAATKYQYFLHGEAVAWGMLGEAYMAYKKQWLAPRDFDRIAALIRRLPRPAFPQNLEMESFLEYIHRCKEARLKQVRVVLLQGLGQAVLSGAMEAEIREALEYLRTFS